MDDSGANSVACDFKTKVARLAAAGNKPEDWKEYIDGVKAKAQSILDESRRNRIISYVYFSAFKVIPETCKTQAHAQLLVDYAEFKSHHDESEAEKLLTYGRRALRRFAIIHVASAELELKRGNKEKAFRILQGAPSIGAEPKAIISSALRRLKEGKTRLFSDSVEENSTDYHLSPCSGRESSEEWSSSQLSWTFGGHRDSVNQVLPICKPNTQEVQQDLDVLTQVHSHLPSKTSAVASLAFDDHRKQKSQHLHPGSSLKSPEPPVLLSKKFSDQVENDSKSSSDVSRLQLSSSHSFASIPETPQSQHTSDANQRTSTCKKSLHHYHSTPDMRQTQGSAMKSSISKFRPLNLPPPRRVKVDPVLKKLQDEEDEHHTADITVSAFEPLHPPTKQEKDSKENLLVSTSEGKPTNSGEAAASKFKSVLPAPPFHISPPSHATNPRVQIVKQTQAAVSTGPLELAADQAHERSRHYSNPMAPENKVTYNEVEGNEPSSCRQQSRNTYAKKLPLSESNALNLSVPKTNKDPVLASDTAAKAQASSKKLPDPAVKVDSSKEIVVKEDQLMQIVQHLVQQQQQQQTPVSSCSATYSVPGPQPAQSNHVTPAKPNMMTGQKIVCVNNKPYTVMRLIGRGGSAKVYQVYDPESNLILALKCVDLSCANRVILDGYKNEIALLRKLQDCGRVIKLYDSEYVAASKKLYVVLEYGETDLCKFFSQNEQNQRALDPITICYFWFQMVTAVHAMHKEGVIHSDLKPANFILVSGQVKLIDFGIANSLQDDSTSVMKENMVGTPSYMSPEALMAIDEQNPKYKVGVRSDVWSLGCILYQMIYGHTPFQYVRQKLLAIKNPAHAISFPDKGDPLLMDVLKKCLIRDVRQRPTTDELLKHPYLRKQSAGAQATPSFASQLENLIELALSSASPRTQQALSKTLKDKASSIEGRLTHT